MFYVYIIKFICDVLLIGGRIVSEIVIWLEKKIGLLVKELVIVDEIKEFIIKKDVIVVGFYKDKELDGVKVFFEVV